MSDWMTGGGGVLALLFRQQEGLLRALEAIAALAAGVTKCLNVGFEEN